MGVLSGKSVKEVLDALSEWGRENDLNGQARQLWDILTALRGPDNGDRVVKEDTTTIIRQLALPGFRDYAIFAPPWKVNQFVDAVTKRLHRYEYAHTLAGNGGSHFAIHFVAAMYALIDAGIIKATVEEKVA